MTKEREQHIALLVAKYVTGEITASEAVELDAWRNERNENGEIFDRMLSRVRFEENVAQLAKSRAETANEWKTIRSRTAIKGRHAFGKMRPVVRYAAAAAVVTMAVLGWRALHKSNMQSDGATIIAKVESVPVLTLDNGQKIELKAGVDGSLLSDGRLTFDADGMALIYDWVDNRTDNAPATTNSLFVPKGTNLRIVLSDGTAVTLNAESTLSYSSAFSGEERHVKLSGEAWFEVAKDAKRPFTVDAGDMDVTVTGTTFGVRAYEGEPVVRTALESGSVEVRAGEQTLTLKPGRQAVFDIVAHSMSESAADLATMSAWRIGRFSYDGATLGEIFADLGRWYDFEVAWDNETLRELRYSLDIRKHARFNDILSIIRATEKVDFKIEGNKVRVGTYSQTGE
jgi:ferric-dicitrate binding protein FerR (iron transport regulator)